jgi:hypothetical protein
VSDLLGSGWFVGIVTGLIVAGIVGVFSATLSPSLRKVFMRRTVDLAGEWDVYDCYPPRGEPSGRWQVKQFGNRVRVNITRHRSRDGSAMKRDFQARGYWNADQLTCLFDDLKGRQRSGAIVLRWVNSEIPTILTGKTVYWDRTPEPGVRTNQTSDGVVAFTYSLKKRER